MAITRRRIGLLVVAVAVAVVAMLPMRALACSCIAMTTEERLERADVVFVGRVERVERPIGKVFGSARVTLAAETVWKGPLQTHFDVEGGNGVGDCTVAFEVGERYVVFATGDPGNVLYTSVCDGTRRLTGAADLAALGPGTPVAPDARVIPVNPTAPWPVGPGDVAAGHIIRDPGVGKDAPLPTDDAGAVGDVRLIAAAPGGSLLSRADAGLATVAGALALVTVGGGAGWLVVRRRRAR
ncbi:hypothetical protein [Sphaerobacter sp.]|uniref:hypothetical protein n=1 Tax=Sphaerobacter sp. TaxID=2099654 RepID=UPI001D455271|nr:hypothetical protein [Sphaerobacter sp.]MBX5445564.1 hypothetical protein [Sphaerobacter sp.]